MNPQLTIELTKAWAEKAQRLEEKLTHMAQGFALFRPETVEQTYRDYERAVSMTRFWSVQL